MCTRHIQRALILSCTNTGPHQVYVNKQLIPTSCIIDGALRHISLQIHPVDNKVVYHLLTISSVVAVNSIPYLSVDINELLGSKAFHDRLVSSMNFWMSVLVP